MKVPVGAAVSQSAGSQLTERFLAVRQTTEGLAAPLSPEDQMLQPMADASPVKWHLAHTSWFFETFLLAPHLPGYRAFHDDFTYLFNSYYNAVGERPARPNRGLMSRPPAEQVMRYRRHVDDAMPRLLEQATAEMEALTELGLNHEQQHQELIVTDIKYGFWSQPLRPAYVRSDAEQARPSGAMEWVPCAGGIHEVGHDGKSFGFDNEGPRHEVLLRPFALGSRLVSNAEYLEFMQDGGYRRPELWLSDGWDAVQNNGWSSPLYWIEEQGKWSSFTCGGVRAVAPHEPVCHVSFYEADAYARWAGARLATEFEWEVGAAATAGWGSFLEDGRFHPAAAKAGDGQLQQMFGDCWEWTASPYVAYPGFRAGAGALGEYNGKFMCNQMVLRGGSCATARSHIRESYRNFFPPHARWQFSGIRLAR